MKHFKKYLGPRGPYHTESSQGGYTKLEALQSSVSDVQG